MLLENTLKNNDGFIRNSAYISTLLFILFIPWGNGIWDGFSQILGLLSFAIAFIVLIFHGTHTRYSIYHLFVALLGAWFLISLIWSPDFDSGIDFLKTNIQLLLLPFLFTLIIDSRNKLISAYQTFVVGNVIASSIIIYNYINGIESEYYNRYGIQNMEVDVLSVMLALAIPITVYLSTQHKNKLLKIFNLLAIPLIIFAIFLTGTRTASIVAIIGILYWVFTHRKSSIIVKLSILGLFIISIITIYNFAPKASVDRIFSSGKSIKSGTLNSRTLIWRTSIHQWKQAPILGTGIGGFSYVVSKKHVNYNGAHNTYIHLLAENGLIGLAIYLLLLLTILYFILNVPMSEKAFLLSLFLVILVSQITNHTHLQKETWFALTMLAIHAHSYSKKT